MPSKGDMIDLVNGLCLIQDRIQAERAFDFIKDPKLSNVEALKVPMFYVWSRLYGHTHIIPTLYHLVEQVPIGWRALKPRHLSISPSACAYYVRETSSTSTSWLKRNATTRMAKRLPSSRKCEDRMCKSAF